MTEDEAAEPDRSAFDKIPDAISVTKLLWWLGLSFIGYITVVTALTLVPQLGAFPLIFAGVAIFPPVRHITTWPLGSPLKREVMIVIYVVFVLMGFLFLFLL